MPRRQVKQCTTCRQEARYHGRARWSRCCQSQLVFIRRLPRTEPLVPEPLPFTPAWLEARALQAAFARCKE